MNNLFMGICSKVSASSVPFLCQEENSGISLAGLQKGEPTGQGMRGMLFWKRQIFDSTWQFLPRADPSARKILFRKRKGLTNALCFPTWMYWVTLAYGNVA